MKDYNIEQKLSNDKGITLVALIITILVMFVIVGVSVNIGTESLDNTRLQGFYTKLEIVQKRIDDIAITNESYVDDSGNILYLKEQGTAFEDLEATKQANLEEIIANEGAELSLNVASFRYFTVEQLESILNLSEIEYNVFVDFETRTVIAEDGLTINGESYHILKSNIYFVEQNTAKNEGTITSLSYNITAYGTNNYKIIVTPSNTVGDLGVGGTLKYKKSTTKYWETASNSEIIISELTQYNILYEDKNKNTISQTITVELDEDGNPTVTVAE